MTILTQKIKEYTSINIKTTHPNWNPSTVYNFATDDTGIVFYGHYYYKSVIDGNVGNIPSEHPESWLLWAISNRYAQTDLHATTETIWKRINSYNPSGWSANNGYPK